VLCFPALRQNLQEAGPSTPLRSAQDDSKTGHGAFVVDPARVDSGHDAVGIFDSLTLWSYFRFTTIIGFLSHLR